VKRLKQINGVEWWKTTEKKPNRGCRVMVLNLVESIGKLRGIHEFNYSKVKEALDLSSEMAAYFMSLENFEYWCYADEFYEQFERAEISTDSKLQAN
jgi:hypothetical protein